MFDTFQFLSTFYFAYNTFIRTYNNTYERDREELRMKRIKKAIRYLSAEYHWRQIIRIRVQINHLYERGVALSSPRMVRLGRLLSKHCIPLMFQTGLIS